MHILLTNDDGYQSKGINVLYQYLTKLKYQVTLIAPKSERSAQSHSMSFYIPIQVEKMEENIYAVNGTPADCVAIALNNILKNNPPQLIISGINHGFNVGIDVNYSGTVGAATEAAIMGYKAIAVSMDYPAINSQLLIENFEKSAKLIANIIRYIHYIDWPAMQVLNVNVPINYQKIAIAQTGNESLYMPHIEELSSQSQKNCKIYLIGGLARYKPKDLSQDVSLVESGFATLSFISSRQNSTMDNQHLVKLMQVLADER